MVWGFCVYFVYMIPLETDVLRKHRFHNSVFRLLKLRFNQFNLREISDKKIIL